MKTNPKLLLLTLANFNQTYPHKSKKINQYWKKVRQYYLEKEGLIHKYGKCEICNQESLLEETGLNWTCNNPNCIKLINQFYNEKFNKGSYSPPIE